MLAVSAPTDGPWSRAQGIRGRPEGSQVVLSEVQRLVRERRKLPPNDLLRQARQRIASPSGSGRSMSRQELADAVNAHLSRTDPHEANLDANHIGKLERGEHRWPNDKRRAAFRNVLRVTTDHELGFYIVRGLRSGLAARPEFPQTAPSLESRTGVAAVDDGSGDIDRRTLFQSVITGVLPGLLGSALSLDDFGYSVPAGLDGDDPSDGDLVSRLRLCLDRAADDDGRNGPGAALPQVITVLTVIDKQVRLVKASARRELLAIGARGAEFAGWLYRDAGAPGWAEYWRDRATEWALEAGDHAMPGYVLLKKSQSAWDARDAVRMLTLAQAVRHWPGRLPARVRAEAAQQEARGHAMIDGNMRAAEQTLGLAQELFNNDRAADITDEKPDLAAHYDRTLLTVQMAICRQEAGQPRRAVDLYRQVLNPEAFSRRDHAYFQSLMALALADAKEPDEAAGAGISALPVAVALGSRRTVRELLRLRRQLAPWAARPAVRVFCAAIAA